MTRQRGCDEEEAKALIPTVKRYTMVGRWRWGGIHYRNTIICNVTSAVYFTVISRNIILLDATQMNAPHYLPTALTARDVLRDSTGSDPKSHYRK